MAWQKGPGEGYHAAKDDALAIRKTLVCRAIYYANHAGARRQLVGFVVEDRCDKRRPRRTIGQGRLSRDAWGSAFFKLGGRYKGGRAIIPR